MTRALKGRPRYCDKGVFLFVPSLVAVHCLGVGGGGGGVQGKDRGGGGRGGYCSWRL